VTLGNLDGRYIRFISIREDPESAG
jgi:hypothetical protein